MRLFILKGLKALHNKLDRTIYPEKYQVADNIMLPFHSLSPISDADVSHYTNAIQWALDNRKKEVIYNIALTGPYGSGKSSILQTFKQNNKNSEYQFLEISLATFKEELDTDVEEEEDKEEFEGGQKGNPDKTGGKSKSQKKNENILRLIELSILQQIFYHEEDQSIPDSRFKKIRSFKKKNMMFITAGTMLALVFGINLFFPDKIEEITKLAFPALLSTILHWFSLIIFIASVSIVIYRSIRLVYGFKVSKLKFQEAEIEIDKNISKSILNNHLDEILYFFEVTKYSVVFIEDLDRFKQAEIFTKLRELNLLINKSKKVEQDVVFVYAVRDEMFKDKDRTKFFDFIIPVIPVINSSNSNDKLIKLVDDHQYTISNDLIDDVSYFIDDMRLLYNITNEYYIYHSLLDAALNQDKLLAMVIYKNIFPDDFVLLHDGEGKLYNLMKKRSEYVNSAIKEIDKEIKEIKDEINQIQKTQLKNGDELRLLYIAKWVSKTEGFRTFNFDGNQSKMEAGAKQSAFEYFKTGKFEYYYLHHSYGSTYELINTSAEFKFPQLEKEVDPEHSYEERLERVEAQGYESVEILKKEIQRLERKKSTIRHAKLKDLLTEVKPKVTIEKITKQDRLLSILLTSGYIDEDYLDYISLFYEGSISKVDRAFLLNIKSQTASDYDYKLSRIDNLISKIRQSDFQYDYIFNYDLMDHLMVNDQFSSQRETLFGQLNDQVAKAIEFIDGFISNGTNIELFIKKLAETWPSFWKYISEKSLYPADKIYVYFKLLILNADTNSLRKQAVGSNLVEFIERDEQFLNLSDNPDLLKNVIGLFNIKFRYIALDQNHKEMSDLIYKGKYYEINLKMVTEVIRYAGNLDQTVFDRQNYSAIRNSGILELQTYVNEKINDYLTEVYFKIPNNKSEPESDLILLLENTNIGDENLKKLIDQIDTKITDLGQMSNEDADDLLFEYNKILATWNNISYYHYRHEEKLSDKVIAFLNTEENAAALGNEELDPSVTFGDDKVVPFLIQLAQTAELTDENFATLSPAFPDDLLVSELHEMPEGRLATLVKGNKIAGGAENYLELKEHFSALRLPFLDNSVDDVIDNQDDYQLGGSEIQYIMRSPSYTKQQKLMIIEATEQEVILKSSATLRELANYIVANFPFPVKKALLVGALKQFMTTNDRVKLFNMHYKQFEAEDIPIIFSTFPGDFKDIGKLTYSPVIDETVENRFLANNLLERKFIANVKDDKRGIRLINFKKAK